MQKLFTKNSYLGFGLVLLLGTATSVVAYRTVVNYRRSEVRVVKKPRVAKVESRSLLKNDEKLQACYQAYLKKDPVVVDGTVQVHMTITNSGAIDHLEMVASDIQDSDFTTCLMNEIKTRRLVATADRLGSIIRHKFNFRRRSPASIDYSDSR